VLNDEEKLDMVEIAGATPMRQWARNDTTLFSY
jgi:hypothetical protein